MCQYQSNIRSLTSRENEISGYGYTVEFQNDAVVEALINSYAAYGAKWVDLLEDKLNRSLQSFDAIILGKFNMLNDSRNTTFYAQMQQFSNEIDGVDFLHTKPPRLDQVASVYKGPIIAVSMFSNRSMFLADAKRMANAVERLQTKGRDNVHFISGRKYISDLGECGSNKRLGTDDCHEVGEFHRCNGILGGHPDLMAWDVIEYLYRLLK